MDSKKDVNNKQKSYLTKKEKENIRKGVLEEINDEVRSSLCENVLNDVNIIFPNKGLFVIKGKSGSGKSTLLNLIAGYDKPTYGKIYYNEVDLCTVNENELSSYQRNEIGFVFQSYNLFDNLTVYENLLFSTDDINENVVDETLTKLEINH